MTVKTLATPLKSVNPATGETIRVYQPHKSKDVETILKEARDAFENWRRTSVEKRAERMKTAAAWLRRQSQPLSVLMGLEMGKPHAQGNSEIEKCAWLCDYYAENAACFLKDEEVKTDASRSYVTFQPLGIILAVMPWNFPFWQAFRCAVPALMAGNAVLLKHASNVTGCALQIEKCFHDSGFSPAIFRTILMPSKSISKWIAHPLIDAVSLTGSTEAGKSVARAAAQSLKKTVLELGGSDPYVVLEDADLAHAAESCVNSRLINSGQSCIAAKRFIVVRSIQKEFEERFVECMKSKKMGDPAEEGVAVGPLARRDLRELLHAQVQKSVDGGARVLLGGSAPGSQDAYYSPTVLSNVSKGMPAYDEETFGPVAAIITADNEREAVRLANDTIFGLGAAVFTADAARGERLAREEILAGSVFVNEFVRSDPRLPFGGIKQSGYGRELSYFGMREFMNAKTIYIK